MMERLDEVRALRDVADLARALRSESVLVRVVALQGLAESTDPGAPALVRGAVRDSWRAVRIVAGDSLAALAGGGMMIGDVGAIPAEALASRRRAVASLDAEWLAHYVAGLEDPDSVVRLAAAEVLGETGAAAAAASLVNALADANMAVVSQATESLVRLGSVAVPALRAASGSANRMTRDSATWCLQQMKVSG